MSKRRANNEGSIYKRQDGRWCASVTLPGGTRKSYYGKTRQEVAQKLTGALKLVQDGLPLPSEQLKVGRYVQEWLQSICASVRVSTWERYEQLLRLYALPAVGHVSLARLEPRHLQRLYTDCLTRGNAPASVRQLHAVLHRALGQAVRWGLLTRNVAAVVSPPRVSSPEMTPLSAVQVQTLLRTVTGDRFAALYVLAVTAGMRLGELLALAWHHLDAEAGTLQVRATLLRTKSGLQLAEPKTARSRRRLTLAPSALEALRQHRRLQAEERLRLGPIWHDMNLMFPNELGKPMDAGNFLSRSFRPLLKRAGLPQHRFHDLRHTAATLMLAQGVHVKVVSEMLGHSRSGMTMDIYAHVLPDMQHQAALAMETLLSRAGNPPIIRPSPPGLLSELLSKPYTAGL